MPDCSHKSVWPVLMLVCCLLAGVAVGADKNLNLERARAAMAKLEDDPLVRELAPREFNDARVAMKDTEIALARGSREARIDQLAYIAEKRIEIAKAVAQRRELESEVEMLSAERETLMVEARKIDAKKSRLEAERARLMGALQEEEAERERGDRLDAERKAQSESRRREMAETEASAAREETKVAVRYAEASQAEADAYRLEAEEAVAAAAKLRRRLDELQAREIDGGVVLTLADIQFEAGSAELRESSLINLENLAEYLLQEHSGKQIRVEGHTDSSGAAEFNLRLSQSRAETVADFLVARGVSGANIRAIGFGEEFPIMANTTDANRKQNRRVEVIIEGAELPEEG
jgi:outer membrane protein OmpA-like peptidoglycan-associated protein